MKEKKMTEKITVVPGATQTEKEVDMGRNLSLDSIDYEATLCAIYSDIIAAKIMIQRKNTKKWKK